MPPYIVFVYCSKDFFFLIKPKIRMTTILKYVRRCYVTIQDSVDRSISVSDKYLITTEDFTEIGSIKNTII